MLLQLKILLVQHSFVLLYPFQQGIADPFLCDHDALFIEWNQVVSLSGRARVPIRAGVVRDE